MRSARMVLATATATAALAIAAPVAHADHAGDEGRDKSSYSEEQEEKGKHDKPHGGMHTGGGALAVVGGDEGHDKSSYGEEQEEKGKHDKPHGGMHTGGGALTGADEEDWDSAKDPKHDSGTYKDKGDSQSEESYSGKQDKEWNHDKPRGGVHTGGGGLAEPGVTAGGLAALAVLGTGAYALRRKKVSGDMA
ncbi:hypothetical protein [Streptomyces sp. NPDC016626]|uniref:hypothetical protein n=1 Tax=Streptomyces sp. NPDC016626 TaxID=3364968 RepID=UPI0036F8B367